MIVFNANVKAKNGVNGYYKKHSVKNIREPIIIRNVKILAYLTKDSHKGGKYHERKNKMQADQVKFTHIDFYISPASKDHQQNS